MVDTPDRIWVIKEDVAASWPGSFRRFLGSDLNHGENGTEYLRADIVASQLAEARADAKLFEATAKEAARGLECLNDIDDAWDAFGTAANRGTLTLAEQISSVSRELDAAEVERERLAADLAQERMSRDEKIAQALAKADYEAERAGNIENDNDRLAAEVARLKEAANNLLATMSDSYKARNGRVLGIQADDGEKCWLVHSDEIEALRAALASVKE